MEVDETTAQLPTSSSKDPEYDYLAEKLGLRTLYEEWRSDGDAA